MSIIRPKKSLTLLWLTLSLLTAAPLPTPESTSRRPEILIGISNAQSGPSALLGSDLLCGSQAYLKLVNAKGGIAGRTLRLVVKDDHYEPEPAVSNTDELIARDHVLFLFDYVGTPTLTRTLPLLRYYNAEEIVNVGPMTGAQPQRRPPYDRYVFSIRASYDQEAQALVNHLYARGIRKFGLLTQADAYGKSGEVAVARALREHELANLATMSYSRGAGLAEDMSAQVGALRNAGAEAVIMFGVYEPCAAFVRTARRANWQIPIAGVSFVGADALLARLAAMSRQDHVDLTANLLNSQVVPNPEDNQSSLIRQFRCVVPASQRGFISLEGWINASIAVEALRRAGPDLSRPRFVQALESLSGWDPGLGVRLSFSHTSHQALNSVWLTQTKGGRWVSVGSQGSFL